MTLVIDSTHPVPVADLKAVGAKAIIRYLQTGSRPSWKSATRAEIDGYRKAGIGVGVCWETTATRALSGFEAGASDARKANAAADALGLPDTVTLVWTVDHTGEPMNTNNRNTTRVSAVAVAGALATIIAWAAKQAGLDVPPEVVAALTTVLAVVVGVLVPGSDR